jgi:hypothetical protein
MVRYATCFLVVALIACTSSQDFGLRGDYSKEDDPGSDVADEGREAIPSDHDASDEIVWGRVARPVQLGWRIVPNKTTPSPSN